MKHILATTIITVGAIVGVAGAEDAPATNLLAEARRAGVEVSPLVFDREADTAPDAEVGGRISGKSIVLATAIVSVAAVTVAWLLRPRSECEPANGDLGYDLSRWWSWHHTPLPPPAPEGVTPRAFRYPTPPPTPRLCAPRGAYR